MRFIICMQCPITSTTVWAYMSSESCGKVFRQFPAHPSVQLDWQILFEQPWM